MKSWHFRQDGNLYSCMTATITNESNIYTITVSGRFTSDAAPDFLQVVDPLMQKKGIIVVLELGEMDFISSAGIRCFVLLHKTFSACGSTLTLRNMPPQIVDIFRMTALLDKFTVE